MRMRLSHLVPLTGLIFAGLVLVSIFGGGNTPNSDASAQKAVLYFHGHHHRETVTTYVFWYGILFAIPFAAALRSYLRKRGGSEGMLTLAFAGMITFVIGGALWGSFVSAATDVPTKISPIAEQALNVLQNDIFVPMLIGSCVFMVGTGLAIELGRMLPRWLGWLAIVIGIVSVIPKVAFFGLLGMLGWTIVVCVYILVTQSSEEPVQAAAAPA